VGIRQKYLMLSPVVLGRPRGKWRIILRWIFRKLDVRVWTGSIWLSIETGGGHL
jgi:hypothetical protein